MKMILTTPLLVAMLCSSAGDGHVGVSCGEFRKAGVITLQVCNQTDVFISNCTKFCFNLNTGIDQRGIHWTVSWQRLSAETTLCAKGNCSLCVVNGVNNMRRLHRGLAQDRIPYYFTTFPSNTIFNCGRGFFFLL